MLDARRCDQCVSLYINGILTHELGCPVWEAQKEQEESEEFSDWLDEQDRADYWSEPC